MLCNCDNCKKEMKIKKSRYDRNKNNFCCKKCCDEHKEKKAYKKMCDKVGMDFKEYLENKYIKEMLTTREIAHEVYNSSKSHSSIYRWLCKFNIPVRHGGEAIKTQWINNEKRRTQASILAKKNLTTKESRSKVYDKMQTKEYKEKMSRANKGEKNGMYGRTGELSSRWNPKRTHDDRVKERKTHADSKWRSLVFERDLYTCQRCGDSAGGNLTAHHIYSYDVHIDERQEENNGITLCEKCHKDFHSKYGYGKNTKQQFDEWIQKCK